MRRADPGCPDGALRIAIILGSTIRPAPTESGWSRSSKSIAARPMRFGVTGCRLGKRALKFRDFGKMAATFCDLREDKAIRVVALESSKDRARELYPDIERRTNSRCSRIAKCRTTSCSPPNGCESKSVRKRCRDIKAGRVSCDECGEGINFSREVLSGGRTLCKSCAGDRYYESL